MSCWRKQTVLRLPYAAVGIVGEGEVRAFERAHSDKLQWREGSFAPTLCEGGAYTFLDYILRDEYPLRRHSGSAWEARGLSDREKEKYLPVFQTLFPDLTPEQMDAVRRCQIVWYDGTDQPYCYDIEEEEA